MYTKPENNDAPFKIKTRGQHPNESQKAVIIDMMKSVGEIASKMWLVAKYLTHFGKKIDLDL